MTTSNDASLDVPFFTPWIGDRYGEDPERMPRVFILGESHWGPTEWCYPEFTRDVIRRDVFGRRDRFFTKIAKLTLGLASGAYLTTPQYHDFWSRVVFWNFVQEMAGLGPGDRPSADRWTSGRRPFLRLLAEWCPDVVIVLGKELWANLPPASREVATADSAGEPFVVRWYDSGTNHTAAAAYVNHPSSRGWRYEAWQPRVSRLLDAEFRQGNRGS